MERRGQRRKKLSEQNEGDDKGKKKPRHSRKKRIQLDEVMRSAATSVASPSTTAAPISQINTSTSTSGENSTKQDKATTSQNETSASMSNPPAKSPNQSSSTQSNSRPSSPEPDCAICLGKLENKSFTDSCFHMFCFVCLMEWSKVKAECPLCKQPFKSIVHNVRSYNDYDMYHIPRPEERNPLSLMSGLFSGMPNGERFRYRTTVTDHRYASNRHRIHLEIENRLLQRPSSHLPVPNWRRLRQPANSDFRRSIYLRRLNLKSENMNTRRRVRETCPSFYRENPAQTHRLVPWLNRELNALLQGHGEQVAFLLDLIIGLIKRHPIESEEFYQHVFPFVGRNTRHFMKEFLAFAKSPYHMAAYDRHVSYEENTEPNIDSDSDSDHQGASQEDGNDSDVVVISPPEQRNIRSQPSASSLTPDVNRPFPSFAPIVRSTGQEDLSTAAFGHRHDMFAPPSASGWDSPTPGPSNLLDPTFYPTPFWNPLPRAFNDALSQNILENPFSVGGFIPTPPIPSQIQSTSQDNPIECNENSDSSESDVEIVEVEKPWNERSPIQLSSAAESDYDVMITGTGHINDEVKKETKKKKHKKHKHDHSKSRHRDKRRRSKDSATSHSSKRACRRSQSRTRSRSPIRSRSRSVSPLRLKIYAASGYQHKKFSYKRQDGDDHDRLYRGFVSQFQPRSRSSSTDSDQPLSPTPYSSKQKSKRRHSELEVVEVRKKSSKHKKSKKHKTDKDATIPKHKHKSKKKKHKKDKSRRRSKDAKSIDKRTNEKVGSDNKSTDPYTSDSDTDSYFEVDIETLSDEVTTGRHKNKEKRRKSKDTSHVMGMEKDSVNKSKQSVPTLALEEITAAQAAIMDEELDSIHRALSNNNYIDSLFSAHDNQNNMPRVSAFTNNSNNSTDLMVNPNEVLNLKRFKKHPYGHKKSGKRSLQSENDEPNQNNSQNASTSAGVTQVSVQEDTIQSSDITSCSDVDTERQLPSFQTLLGLNSRFSSNSSRKGKGEASQYDSPTSTNMFGSRVRDNLEDIEASVVDVETISNNSHSSNIDVVTENSESIDVTRLSVSNIRDGSPAEELDQVLDVEGDSDSECEVIHTGKKYSNQSKDRLSKHVAEADQKLMTSESDFQKNNEYIEQSAVDKEDDAIVNVEIDNEIENDSDIECSLVEGHKTFEIAESSDEESKEKEKEVELDVETTMGETFTGRQNTSVIVESEEQLTENVDTVKYNCSENSFENDDKNNSSNSYGTNNKNSVERNVGERAISGDINEGNSSENSKSAELNLSSSIEDSEGSEFCSVDSPPITTWTVNPSYESGSLVTSRSSVLEQRPYPSTGYLSEESSLSSVDMSPSYPSSPTPSPGYFEPES